MDYGYGEEAGHDMLSFETVAGSKLIGLAVLALRGGCSFLTFLTSKCGFECVHV